MATQDYAASVQGAAIRVTRLSSSGSLLNGSLDSYTTSAFIRMSFTPEYEDGEEITEKAADGTVCVSYKAPDRLKRVTMELAICEPDPELTALLAGGVLLTRDISTATPVTIATGSTSVVITSGTAVVNVTSTTGIAVGTLVTIGGAGTIVAATGGDMEATYTVTAVVPNTSFSFVTTKSGTVTVTGVVTATVRDDVSTGWAAPAIGDDPSGNGVAIEVWSHAVANGKRASSYPYFHWIFPYARLRQSGDRVIENGLLANTFEGYGIGNSTFASGPDGRWAWSEVTDRPYAYARSTYSPSSTHLKGFYTWSSTTGDATAVNNLPLADLDNAFNIPGGQSYVAGDTDIIDGETAPTVGS